MKYRTLGRTGLRVPEVGFGCGNVGGLMVRGTHEEQVSAVRRAIAYGIDYFDTAAAYGDGQSEANLGAVLAELRPDVRVATKFRVGRDELGDIPGAVRRSLEGSLVRLRMSSVDVLQLHTNLTSERGATRSIVGVANVLGKGGVADSLDTLRSEGLVRHIGFTGMGETDAVHQVVDSGRFDTVQAYYNVLNPSAGDAVPAGFPNQDYRRLMARAAGRCMGVIVIRVLAGGALGGPEARRGLASPTLGPAMATGNEYDGDVKRAASLGFLEEGGSTAAGAAVRFALDNPSASVVLVGFSGESQIDAAVAAVDAPALGTDAHARIERLWASDFARTPPACRPDAGRSSSPG